MAKRGNPKPTGSKPDKILRDALMVALHREDEDPTTKGKKMKRFLRIADQISKLAASGDLPAIKEVWDRVEGKASQPIEHTGDALENWLERLGKTGGA